MPKLIFTDKKHIGQIYELTLEKTTVGRDNQNILIIPDHSLSAQHCEILMHGPEVIVHDLGSRNGTFVNGVKLQNHQAQLKSGQTVRFGSVEARLELDGPDDDESVSDITAVFALSRIMRDQKRAENNPKPADASMKLKSSDSSSDSDRTVTAFAPPSSTDRSAPAVPSPAGSPPGKSSKKTAIMIVTALVLLALLWLWWSRR